MKLIVAVAAVLAVCALADEEAATSAVSVKYMGASGGIKIFPNGDENTFIMVKQDKLQEVTSAGKATRNKINVAGPNTWTPLKTTKISDTATDYSTTFEKTEGDMTFQLVTHLSTENLQTTDVVPCQDCNGESFGECQDANNNCAALLPDDKCPDTFTQCTVPVTTRKDQLKFSIVVSGWKFLDPSNHLEYGLDISSKGGKGEAASMKDSGSKEKKTSVGGGFILTPTEDSIVGGAGAPVSRDVVVNLATSSQKTTIDFEFQHFGEGETLYYDPDLGFDSAANSMALPSLLLLTFVGVFNIVMQ